MAAKQGLTGLQENGRGYLGYNPIKDTTKRGRQRIRFQAACGERKPEFNKYPTWRYCVGYDEVVEVLERAVKGSYVKFSGWLATEAVLDDKNQPVMVDGQVQLRETLVLYNAELLAVDSVDRQLALITGK